MRSHRQQSHVLTAVVVFLCVMQAFQYLSRVNLDDDNLYLAYLAERQADRVSSNFREAAYVERLKGIEGCDRAIWRFGFRAEYGGNYPLLPKAETLIRSAFPVSAEKPALWIVGPMLLARALMLLMAWGLVALAVFRFRDRQIQSAILAGLALALATDITASIAYHHLRGQDFGYLGKVAYHMGKWQLGGSPLQNTPRNTAAALFLVAILLKWGGHIRFAVLTLIAVALIHRTYTGLQLVLFTGLLLFTARAALRDRVTLALLVTGFATAMLRELYWGASSMNIVGALALSLLAGLVIRLLASARFDVLIQGALGAPEPGAERRFDALLLIAAYGILCLAKTLAPSKPHFWGELLHRVPLICQMPVIVGLSSAWLQPRLQTMTSHSQQVLWWGAVMPAGLVFAGLSLSLFDTEPLRRHQERLTALIQPSNSVQFNAASQEQRVYLALLGETAPASLGLPRLESLLAGRTIVCQGGE